MTQQQPKRKAYRAKTKFDKDKAPIGLTPRNENQKLYLDALDTSDQIIVSGPAGTGKTFCAATKAASLYHTKVIDRIVITRPHIPVGPGIGFLKGDLGDKTLPWALPVLDVLEKTLGKAVVETGIKNGNIEVAPMALMRGRSFEDSFVIVDEAQNMTLQEVKMLVTRIGEGSKLVINGDTKQSDLKETDGLSKLLHFVKKYSLPIPIIEFTVEDIVRSDICKEWIKVFDKEGV